MIELISMASTMMLNRLYDYANKLDPIESKMSLDCRLMNIHWVGISRSVHTHIYYRRIRCILSGGKDGNELYTAEVHSISSEKSCFGTFVQVKWAKRPRQRRQRWRQNKIPNPIREIVALHYNQIRESYACKCVSLPSFLLYCLHLFFGCLGCCCHFCPLLFFYLISFFFDRSPLWLWPCNDVACKHCIKHTQHKNRNNMSDELNFARVIAYYL